MIAFNVPNLIRSLVADTAIAAAFVPVFVELRERGEEPEAWRVAGIVLWTAAVVLGAISAIFMLLAPCDRAAASSPATRTSTPTWSSRSRATCSRSS